MKKLFLIVILSFLVSCSTTEKRDLELVRGKAIVEGKVRNFKNNSKVLRFATGGVVEDIDQIAEIDSLGKFRTEIVLFNPQNVNLLYEKGFTSLYIKPDDSLFLDIDADLFKQKEYPHYEISGLNSKTSQNIRDFLQFYNPFSYEPHYNKSVKEFWNELKQQMIIEDSVRNVFAKVKYPTKEFMRWANINMQYNYANALIGYYAHWDLNYKQLKPEIYNSIMFPVDNDSAIVSGLYETHLSNYTTVKYLRGDSIVTKLFKEKNIAGAYNRILDKLFNNEKPGLSRDIMIYKQLLKLSSESFESFVSVWQSKKRYIRNQELVSILKEKKLYYENQKENQTQSLGLELKAKQLWKTIHSKHTDNIIYVDIWATWCGPCRAEIPHTIDLQNYFKGKPIAFVNLCLASDKDDWEKMIVKNNIIGDNYFFNKDETALLRNELKFAGYPTYMILDKKGKIINKDAPRPSNGNVIRDVLNRLLEQ